MEVVREDRKRTREELERDDDVIEVKEEYGVDNGKDMRRMDNKKVGGDGKDTKEWGVYHGPWPYKCATQLPDNEVYIEGKVSSEYAKFYRFYPASESTSS